MRDEKRHHDAEQSVRSDAAASHGSEADTRSERYWSLAIDVASEHAEWLGEQLVQIGFSAFEERDTARGKRLLVYADTTARLRDVEQRLLESGAEERPPRELACEIAELGTEWELAWTRHLTPIQLTPTLRAVPHAPGEARLEGELYLEPAFAFGFGEHASTRLIASWLSAACRRQPLATVLDVGCGTGVLALVAAQSGAARVLGVDTSLAAVRAATANAELNRITNVAFAQRPVAEVEGVFDLVVANIEATVLVELVAAITRKLAPAGELALSGFIADQVEEVARAYRRHGRSLAVAAQDGDWCLLATV